MNRRLSHIDTTLTRPRIQELLQAGEPPRVSLYLSTHRAWNKRKQNRLMLDRLRTDTAEDLKRRGWSDDDVAAFLSPISDLVSDSDFWRTVKDGLAVFLARDHFSAYRVPFSLPQAQFVDTEFQIRPLWQNLVPNGRFYVLALAQGGIKLFRGSRYVLREVELEDVPTSLEEALEFDEHIRSVIFHTKAPDTGGGKRAAIFHGQEDAGDKTYVKEGILRFFRALDNAVRDVLNQDARPSPLILAGVEYVRGLYRKVNHYAHVTDQDIEGNLIDDATDEFDVKALHEGAWPIVEPLFSQDMDASKAEVEQRLGQGEDRAAASIDTVVPAAFAGRIDTLFVSSEDVAWGRYDPEVHDITVREDAGQSDDVELLNAAAVETLRGNGSLYVVDPSALPGGGSIAALLRY